MLFQIGLHGSKVILTGDFEGFGLFGANILFGAFDAGMSEQQLGGAQVAGLLVDMGRKGPAQRVQPVEAGIDTGLVQPGFEQSPELALAEVGVRPPCPLPREQPTLERLFKGGQIGAQVLRRGRGNLKARMQGADYVPTYIIRYTENQVCLHTDVRWLECLFGLLDICEHERDGPFQERLPINAQVCAGMQDAAIGVIVHRHRYTPRVVARRLGRAAWSLLRRSGLGCRGWDSDRIRADVERQIERLFHPITSKT